MSENETAAGTEGRGTAPLRVVEDLGLPRRSASGREPVILDAGKVRRKAIKALKGGQGSLLEEIEAIAQEARNELKASGSKREVVPLVLIYRRAPRRLF